MKDELHKKNPWSDQLGRACVSCKQASVPNNNINNELNLRSLEERARSSNPERALALAPSTHYSQAKVAKPKALYVQAKH